MSRYRKYTDTYPAILTALKLPFEYPETSEEERKHLYTSQIDKDKSRAVVVELRPGHNALQSENIIYDHAHYQKNPYYSQGDYEARPYCTLYIANPNFLNEITEAATKNGDRLYTFELGFPYINDEGVPCALGITRFGHGPDAQYTITLIRNTVDADDKREVLFICTEKIAQDEFYTALQGSHNETTLNSAEMVQSVTEQIGSAEISQLFRTILDEAGNISEQKLAKLKTRLGHHNLDDRDLFIHQIPFIMATANALDPSIAKKINRYYTKHSLEFFEHDHYKKLLTDLMYEAETQQPPNPVVINAFQDLYLEFITIDFYYHTNGGHVHSKTGLLSKHVTDLQTEYSSALQNSSIDPVAFTKKINQSHRAIHYKNLISKLEQAIRTGDPTITPIALKELPWIKKCDLAKYSPAQQNTIIEFVAALNSFTENPNTLSLEQLEKLYPKVRRDPTGLDPIKPILEAENFAKQIKELEKKIAACQHPYIKDEAEKKLRYFQNRPFGKESSTRQALINNFLTTLNQFVGSNLPGNLTQLAELYDPLNLIPIEPEKAESLLLPLNIAQMRHQIDQNQYTFDPQGRALVTVFGSNMSPDIIIWSLDIADAPNTDMGERFYRPLSTELKKHIAPNFAPKIIALFNHNKTAIYPLQQVMQMYLSQIAQTYQAAMQAEGVTSQMMQTALMATNKKMNAVIIKHLAVGLVYASVHEGKMLANLNMETLNKRLTAVQDKLRQDGKKLFIRELHKQMQQETTHTRGPTTQAMQEISNKILYFDTKQSLATEISALQSDSEATYRRIKTYRCQGTSFTPSNAIQRSAIHSSALSLPESIPAATYQTQFQDRLTQLSKTCRYKKTPALTYYVYAANDLQIQQTLNAAHAYNRKIKNEDSNLPLCFVQAPAMSESNKILGYPMLDWSGAISDLTLMHEMSLCSQIQAVDSNQALDLKNYFNFLNPPHSLLSGLRSNVFAFSTEGRQMRAQIQTLKTAWQQDENLEIDLGNQKFTTKTLQKLMAFDLHYNPQYALLVQAMSLTISQQTLLNDASHGQILADTLGHAQIFDIHPLPAGIQSKFEMLLKATDKQTANIAARLLQDEIQRYCADHPNSIAVAAMLPIMAQQTLAVQVETTEHAIHQVQSYLRSPPEPSESSPERLKTRRTFEKEHTSTRQPSQTRHISTAAPNHRHRLFTEKHKDDTPADESLLHKAAIYKARAFKR